MNSNAGIASAEHHSFPHMDPDTDGASAGHHVNIMDSEAERASAEHRYLSDVNPGTDVASAGHHDLNYMDSGAGGSSAEHHRTIGTGEAPVQHDHTTGVSTGGAPVFSSNGDTVQQTDTRNNASFAPAHVKLDQLTNQHRTPVFAREETQKIYTQSRMTTESCHLAALTLPNTQHFNQPPTQATLQVSQQPEPLTHAATNDDVSVLSFILEAS